MKKKILSKRNIIITSLIIIIAIGIFASRYTAKANVESEVVGKGSVIKYIDEIGELKPKEQIYVKTQISGIINNVKVEEGDLVNKGDILLELDTTSLELELKSLEANLRGLYAELEEASTGTDKEVISGLNAQIAIAENEYEKNKEVYENNKVLFESGAISKTEYNTSKTLYENSLEQLNIARNDLLLQTKELSNNLRETYEARIDSLSYQIEELKNQINKAIIKADIDGIITEKLIEKGDFVNLGQKLIEISQKENYIIETDILASDTAYIKEGQKVIIDDPESDNSWEGTVTKIYPKAFSKLSDLGIDQKRVKVDIEPKEITLTQYGYELDLKIIINEANDVIRVRNNSLFEINGEDKVFIVDNNRLKIATVEIGLEGEEYSEVVNGIELGHIVVNSPDNSLEEGIKIK